MVLTQVDLGKAIDADLFRGMGDCCTIRLAPSLVLSCECYTPYLQDILSGSDPYFLQKLRGQ